MTTIVTTCMGRLSFLKQTLPTWLRTGFHVVVVDYDCPDGTGQWVESCYWPQQVTPLYVDADLTTYTNTFFNKARALNHAFRWLARRGESRVVLLDADTLLLENRRELEVSEYEFRIVAAGVRDLTGVLAAPLGALMDIGGANEAMVGYGVEDLDLRLRLYLRARLRVSYFTAGTFGALEHDDELRTRHYPQQDLYTSAEQNMDLMWQSLTPRELAEVALPTNTSTLSTLLGGLPPMDEP